MKLIFGLPNAYGYFAISNAILYLSGKLLITVDVLCCGWVIMQSSFILSAGSGQEALCCVSCGVVSIGIPSSYCLHV